MIALGLEIHVLTVAGSLEKKRLNIFFHFLFLFYYILSIILSNNSQNTKR